MRRFERIVVIWALLYMAAYALGLSATIMVIPGLAFGTIAPFHLLGMAQNLLALLVTIRDLYKRPFRHENQKLTWLLLITGTGGLGRLIYVFKYALKPRPVRADVASLILGDNPAD